LPHPIAVLPSKQALDLALKLAKGEKCVEYAAEAHRPIEVIPEVVLSILIGLDVGGTMLKAAKLDGNDKIVAKLVLPAGGKITRKELARRISDCVKELSQDGRPEAVGLCFGGLLQQDGTMRQGSTNLSNLDGVPLREFFAQLLQLPCKIDNDAIAAMQGEAAFGAARGHKNAMTMTFGSGIGSGLLLDGRIYRGTHGRAGEIGVWRLAAPQGDITVPTVEDVAAPARFLRRHGADLAELLGKASQHDDARILSQSAVEAVGHAIANAHLHLDLEAVILTGGIAALGDTFLNPIKAAYQNNCPAEYQQGMEIKIGELGAYAGAVGAAVLWFEDNAA
jgi:glucokinase